MSKRGKRLCKDMNNGEKIHLPMGFIFSVPLDTFTTIKYQNLVFKTYKLFIPRQFYLLLICLYCSYAYIAHTPMLFNCLNSRVPIRILRFKNVFFFIIYSLYKPRFGSIVQINQFHIVNNIRV